MDINIDNAVLTKIRNALNLAENAATEGEAAAASAAVARLLQKYNLDLADVIISGNAEDLASTMGDIIQVPSAPTIYDSARKSAWVHRIAIAVAEAYFCRPMVSLRQVWFVGYDTNAKAASHTFNYLYTTLTKLSDVAKDVYIQNFKAMHRVSPVKVGGAHHPQTWRKSWLWGAADGVTQKLKETLAEVQGESMALVVVQKDRIDEFITNLFGNRKQNAKSRKHEFNGNAYKQGYQTGKNLDPGLANSLNQLES